MAPHGCASKRDFGIVCAIGVARGLGGGGGWMDEPPSPDIFSVLYLYMYAHTHKRTHKHTLRVIEHPPREKFLATPLVCTD